MEPQPDQERWGEAQKSMIAFCRQRIARERVRRGFFPSLLSVETKAMPPMACPSKQHQQLLLSHGDVVWAHVVQANSLIFQPGPQDLQAWVVYSEDRHFDDGIDGLETLGKTLYWLKDQDPQDPELARWSERLKELDSPFFKLPVPSSLTAGREVRCTTIMVFRDHLPGAILVNSWFPLLVLEELKKSMILPGAYWPHWLCEKWREQAAALETSEKGAS